MCRVFTGHGFCVNNRRILPWTHAWRSKISQVGSWNVREHRHDIRRRATRARDLPQVSHSRKVDTTVRRGTTRDYWKGVPNYRLDSDVVWSDRVHGILQRQTFGTMSGALHHGTDLSGPGLTLPYAALRFS